VSINIGSRVTSRNNASKVKHTQTPHRHASI